MSDQNSINMVRKTFESSFDRGQFIYFIKNLFNEYESAEISRTGQNIPDAYSDYVSKYERIGKYEDSDKKRIDILIVYLKKEASIGRARSMQRNFIAGYLKGNYGTDSYKDAALVAFVSPNWEDWRFSLVKLEVKFAERADDDGRIKLVDEFTPAKRWSFLVGSHEKSHTAQRQFQPILEDLENNPTLEDLEGAFNIEKVTDEFFREYRRLFIEVKSALDKAVKVNPKTKADFESKGIDTVNLAKKLMGQIIFLYYLQKKGWFGVPQDGKWGEGSKNFLRELFEKKHGEYEDFFNDVLEPLFYDALRMDRSDEDYYYKRFKCKIPFLNGGLFDPMGNYNWEKTVINLSNSLFSNKTKNNPEGDGILDVFDLYNFTVNEDEPFEKEVAIDPELLGKAYERFNAIRPDNYDEFLKALKSGKKGDEGKFNKQYGVYYTPREIVHYMCQQSLIHYLVIEMNGIASKEELTMLILRGEQIKEHDARVVAEGRETKAYSFLMPESIRKNAAFIDLKLGAIKVCDPAVGSGAFPVGMMTEIVRAREVVKTWAKTTKTSSDFKRDCIENSLYGVDIDAGAVEIAKLRLWLSLIVDEINPQHIKPLPNLEYKIVCGNSLLSVEKNLFNLNLFTELESQKKLYFNVVDPLLKQDYKKKIDGLIDKITSGRARFDFQIYFSEIFHDNGGFDVVIGNPPYLESRHPDFSDELKDLYQASSKIRWNDDAKNITRGADLLIYFFENAIYNVNQDGCTVLITQNSWLDTEYGKKFQNFLLKNTQVRLVIDSDYRYFASGDGPNINAVITLFAGKTTNPKNIVTFARYHEPFERVSDLEDQESSQYVDSHRYSYKDHLLKELKWGILLSSSTEVLALIELLNKKAKKIGDISGEALSFGQGLNLTKDHIVDQKMLALFPYAKKAAIPFFTSDDGSIFNVVKTANFILDKKKLSKDELKNLKTQNITPFDSSATSKKTPKLIMPRGISKHYCALNSTNCYSSSFVDLYSQYETISEEVLLNLWCFFNSSLFWLLREVSGRKNLGGGMLKSEAVDVEAIPVYMEFKKTGKINEILQRIGKRQALVSVDEIDTEEHKQIDKIIFDHLELNADERKNIIATLKRKINDREKKAST